MYQVDAHQHFWRLERGDYGWLTPDLGPLHRDYLPAEMAPLLHKHGIQRTVLIQAAPTAAETRFLLELADAHPFIAAVVGWVDMEAADAAEQLSSLREHPILRGVRPMIQDIDDPDWMLSKRVDSAFRALTELDLSFDALVQPRHLRNLLTLLERHPELRVVIDHAAKPDISGHGLAEWRRLMRPLATDTAAYCKLSGLVTEAADDWTAADVRPYADEVLERFGGERVMWGSDWPVVNLAGGYDAWRKLTASLLDGASDADRAAILGGTATCFYRLGGHGS